MQLFTQVSHDEAIVLQLIADPRTLRHQQKQKEYNFRMRQISLLRQPRLVFDVSKCCILDSVTLGILISLTKESIRLEGRVGLCGVRTEIEDTLSRLMVLEPKHRQLSWDVYDDIGAAVQGLMKTASRIKSLRRIRRNPERNTVNE